MTHWIIVDVRCAQFGVRSGISRVLISLAQNWARMLGADEKLLFVAHFPCPQWVSELGAISPNVSYERHGARLSHMTNDKPLFLWSTIVFQRLFKVTHGRLTWFSIANFDAPIVGIGQHRSVVQVIHDDIPLRFPLGILFSLQFRILVWLRLKFRHNVVTTSQHAASALRRFVGQTNTNYPPVIRWGVSAVFSARTAPSSLSDRDARRERFLSQFVLKFDRSFIQKKWVLGVGREEPYKRWDVLQESCARIDEVCLIRIGAYANTASLQKIEIQHLDESDLCELMLLADVLAHPSEAEGFGIPPLEAYACGLAVIYRGDTAVEQHLHWIQNADWLRMGDSDVGAWTQALRQILVRDFAVRSFDVESRTLMPWSIPASEYLSYFRSFYRGR